MSKVKSVSKKRIPNFTNLEKFKLIELIEREKHIIENKKTDNITVKDKEQYWMNITNEFNSSCISGYRDINSLKNCWDNLTKKTHKHYAEIRSELFKTGGGKMNIIDDPIADRVKSIIQPSVVGLKNNFDNDYMPGIDDSQCSKELEDEKFYQVEVLEDQNSHTINLIESSSVELNSANDIETQNNYDEMELTLADVETVLVQHVSSKKTCTSVANKSRQPTLKRKRSKQLEITRANEMNDLLSWHNPNWN